MLNGRAQAATEAGPRILRVEKVFGRGETGVGEAVQCVLADDGLDCRCCFTGEDTGAQQRSFCSAAADAERAAPEAHADSVQCRQAICSNQRHNGGRSSAPYAHAGG
jgi:hypothetical protein